MGIWIGRKAKSEDETNAKGMDSWDMLNSNYRYPN